MHLRRPFSSPSLPPHSAAGSAHPCAQPPSLRNPSFTTPLRVLLATTAALWMGGALAQGAAPADAAPAQELRFRDFFRSPVGAQGLEITDTLRNANGRAVRITGYMVQTERPVPGRFLLTPRPVQMSEHADGDADDLPAATLTVYLDASQHTWLVPHVAGLVQVRGTLRVGREEASDGRVSWVRMQLPPDALRSADAHDHEHASPAPAPAPHMH